MLLTMGATLQGLPSSYCAHTAVCPLVVQSLLQSSEAQCWVGFQMTGPADALPSAADGFVQAVATWYEEIDQYNYSKPGVRSARHNG